MLKHILIAALGTLCTIVLAVPHGSAPFPRAATADSWEFHVTSFTSTTRGLRSGSPMSNNLTVAFDVQDMYMVNGTQTHCMASFPPREQYANGTRYGYPSKSAGTAAGCDDKSWTWYYSRYDYPGAFSINLEHVVSKQSVGPEAAVYYGTGPYVSSYSDPVVMEDCSASGYCDYWLNSTLVVPMTSAAA